MHIHVSFEVLEKQAICLKQLFLHLKTPQSHCEKDCNYQTMLSDLDHPRKLNLTFLVQILFPIQVMIKFSTLLAQVMAKYPGFAPGVDVVVSS